MKNDELTKIHNTSTIVALTAIIKPTIVAGGGGPDVLGILESTVVGVMMAICKEGRYQRNSGRTF